MLTTSLYRLVSICCLRHLLPSVNHHSTSDKLSSSATSICPLVPNYIPLMKNPTRIHSEKSRPPCRWHDRPFVAFHLDWGRLIQVKKTATFIYTAGSALYNGVSRLRHKWPWSWAPAQCWVPESYILPPLLLPVSMSDVHVTQNGV